MSEFLNSLARPAVPVPAGATVAALALAQAAALLSRAAGGHAEADRLTRHALRLAEKDAHAVAHPAQSWAEPAADVVGAAGEVVALAEQVVSTVEPTALPDVCAAVEMARSSAFSARVAVEARDGTAPEVDGLAERVARVTEAARAGAARSRV
ncbi:hypothetical protein [Amycolatopsis jiangsuensis]|uniref:Formiminotetrahydrofolate cyclodeaminase n=1 Tax=Amycolatopsis jiangsuensis TaxID=1181879 RepID=A0A840IMP9_9PSEU|nr:hypothetical protein [Amycolatopsis jiangsuensis]MBB4683681.1 formiminotetrahydrofolate cyclodeaminase [Amycolatopsis jiangsuensis]